eukprot:389829-Rhodomonas_salina.2
MSLGRTPVQPVPQPPQGDRDPRPRVPGYPGTRVTPPANRGAATDRDTGYPGTRYRLPLLASIICTHSSQGLAGMR